MRRAPGWARWSLLAAITAGGLPRPASAEPEVLVVGSGGDTRDTKVRATVEYRQSRESSEVVRERAGAPGADPLAPDLDFEHVRHTVTPRLELTPVPWLFVSAALPVVVSDTRELTLHDGVDRSSSSTFAEGLLPAGGFDAEHPGTAFSDTDLRAFRGRQRQGLDQVVLGLGATLMSQRRDQQKPTWRLGAELGLAVGKVARFDPANPAANEAVGRGVHEVRVWTSIAKRISFVEPTFALAWKAPLVAKDAALFRDLGYGATNVMPPQEAQVRFDLEAIALERPADHLRLGVALGSRLDARFEGRDYSEMWEVFALAGDANNDSAPLVLDSDPVTQGAQRLSHPGITNVENHLELGGQLALRAQLGKYVQLAATAELVWKTDHAITFADAGIDLPTCDAGQTTGCETRNNDLIDAGTEEENPAFAPLVDLVGRRYRSVSGTGLVLGVVASGAF